MFNILLRASLLSILVACNSVSDAYDDGWGSEEISAGKADGLLDDAPEIEFGETGRGFVEGEQLDVYALDLKRGDRITLEQHIEAGDLSPHFTLYFGGSSAVHSVSYTRSAAHLTKLYEIDDTGRYFIAVKPYQGTGAGNYALTPTCTGGPCAGGASDAVLTADERGYCLEVARLCAFAALPAYNGLVGPARSQTIFQGCLATVPGPEGEYCDSACEGNPDAIAVCADLIGALPFYADQSAACIAELDRCWTDCAELGEFPTDDDAFAETTIAMCWSNGYNGTCDSYARDHEVCGGDGYAADTNAECHAFCESTNGAWRDDLDTTCAENCP